MGKNKKPKIEKQSFSRKKPRSIVSPGSYKNKKPSWAFSKAVKSEKYSAINDGIIICCVETLAKFENMTWSEIETATHDKNKSSNHYINVENIQDKNIIKAIVNRGLNSERLFSLRATNLVRIYGILEENGVFYVLWYDEKHEIVKTKQ